MERAEVALAWLRARPGVASVSVGARTAEQLASNLASLDLDLADRQRRTLDQASALAPDYSSMTDSPGLASAVFGGASVEGWR